MRRAVIKHVRRLAAVTLAGMVAVTPVIAMAYDLQGNHNASQVNTDRGSEKTSPF